MGDFRALACPEWNPSFCPHWIWVFPDRLVILVGLSFLFGLLAVAIVLWACGWENFVYTLRS